MTSLANLINKTAKKFWRGKKFAYRNKSSHLEAQILFSKKYIIFLSSSIAIDAGKTPPKQSKAEIKITRLSGNFKISKGEFKGGIASGYIHTANTSLNDSKKNGLYKTQEWRRLSQRKRKISQNANIFSLKKAQEIDILVQLTGNKAWKYGAMAEGRSPRVEDLSSWQQSKVKLKSLGFKAIFLDKFLGYTQRFKSVDLFEKAKREHITHTIKKPSRFDKKSADKIINFNLSNEKLKIKAKAFGIKDLPSFKSAKNKKELKKLARKDFDFLYDHKKGGLYFNENGAKKGFGDGGIVAILKGGPDLTSKGLMFV